MLVIALRIYGPPGIATHVRWHGHAPRIFERSPSHRTLFATKCPYSLFPLPFLSIQTPLHLCNSFGNHQRVQYHNGQLTVRFPLAIAGPATSATSTLVCNCTRVILFKCHALYVQHVHAFIRYSSLVRVFFHSALAATRWRWLGVGS